MKKILGIISILLLTFVATGCIGGDDVVKQLNPSVDSITSPSGNRGYVESSYDLETLKQKLTANQFGNIVPAPSISTTNEDGTPNVAVFIPTLKTIDDKNYIVAWFSNDTHTIENLKERQFAVYMFYEYDNTVPTPGADATESEKTQAKLAKHKGCRVVLKYVGDEKQGELATSEGLEAQKNNRLFLEIVEILPLG